MSTRTNPIRRNYSRRLHLLDHTGPSDATDPDRRSICGRPLPRYGDWVAGDLNTLTCRVCKTEIGRARDRIDEFAAMLGPQTFAQVLGQMGWTVVPRGEEKEETRIL